MTIQGTADFPWLGLVAFALVVAASRGMILALGAILLWLRVREIKRAGQPDVRVRTFGDGDREVVFVEMCHVGPPAYYDRVREIIAAEGRAGATYLYEGVAEGEPGDRGRLMRLIGVPGGAGYHGFLRRIAHLAAWQHQPQASFMGLTGRPDVRADLDATTGIAVVEVGMATATGRLLLLRRRLRIALAAVLAASGAGRLIRPVLRAPLAIPAVRAGVASVLRHVIGTMMSPRPGVRRRPAGRPRRPAASRWPPVPADILDAGRDAFLHARIAETPGRLVVTYGQGHLPALREFLNGRGDGEEVRSEALPFPAWGERSAGAFPPVPSHPSV